MDIKNLYTLIAIADRASFASAAQALGLSVSAVSMQMRALEEELGATLFDRSRRPPVLTNTGMEFTQRARQLIAHWESMSDALKREAAGGILKLGAVHSSVSGVLPMALSHILEQGRHIDIRLTTGLSHELEKAVFHRQLDAAIVTEPETIRSEFEFVPFLEEALVVIAHVTTAGDTDQAVLESTPYVQFARATRVGSLIEEDIARRQIAVQSQMEVDTVEGVVALVAQGLGSSVIPSRGIENEYPATIRSLPFGQPPLTRRVGLLIAKSHPRNHLAYLLLDSLRLAAGHRH